MGVVILLPNAPTAANLEAQRRAVSRAAVVELSARGGRGSDRYRALYERAQALAHRERQMRALEATIAEANASAPEDRRR